MKKQVYDDSSIDLLQGSERVKRRPEVMLGTSDLKGTRHTVTEILGNSLDEASSGYGTKIDVVYYEDTAISIRDYGRGVPLGYNVKYDRWNWDLIYNEMYAGGKLKDLQKELEKVDWNNINIETFVKEFNYLFSVGLNGLGCASVQYTSKYFEVRSYRDGKCSRMCFENGEPVFAELEITDTDEPNGTFVKWLPSENVFSHTDVGGDWLYKNCVDVLQTAGLDLTFENKVTGFSTEMKCTGLRGILAEKYGKVARYFTSEGEPEYFECSEFSHGNTLYKGKPVIYVFKADVLLTIVDDYSSIFCFHNSTKLSGGSPFNGFNLAVKGFFAEKCEGIRLDSSDFNGLLGAVISSYSNVVSYEGQTKNVINNEFIEQSIYKAVYDKLNLEFSKGNKKVVDLVSKVRTNAENRIAIKEYEKTLKQVSKLAKEKPPEKFVTCKAYDKKQSELAELWITEGDSALSACKRARDSKFQALFPVKGKVLNVLKNSIARILGNGKTGGNQEIKGLFALLETGMELGDDTFDYSKLRFNKIIFATDADVDGYQIRVLLFIAFYRFAPQLLRNGNVYIAETPLYSVKLRNGTTLYAINDAELVKLKETHGNDIKTINRFKGLGECNKDVLWETTMCPETRNLIPLTLDTSDKLSQEIITVLFGNDKGKERKRVLTEVLGSTVIKSIADNARIIEEINALDIDDGIEYEQLG